MSVCGSPRLLIRLSGAMTSANRSRCPPRTCHTSLAPSRSPVRPGADRPASGDRDHDSIKFPMFLAEVWVRRAMPTGRRTSAGTAAQVDQNPPENGRGDRICARLIVWQPVVLDSEQIAYVLSECSCCVPCAQSCAIGSGQQRGPMFHAAWEGGEPRDTLFGFRSSRFMKLAIRCVKRDAMRRPRETGSGL